MIEMRKGTPEQISARDVELRERQDARTYNKAYREANKERLQEYEKQRYQKSKSVVN